MPRVISWAVMLIGVVMLTGGSSARERSPSGPHSSGSVHAPFGNTAQPSQASRPEAADPRIRLREGVNREDLDAEGQRTYDFIVNPTNPHSAGLPTPIGMWMYSPKMAQHILPAYMYLRFGTQLEVRFKEIAILVTGRQLSSRTQWGTHETNALKVGVEPEVIDVIKYFRSPVGLGEKEALIIRFGRELLGDKSVSPETFAYGLKIFGREKLTDLAGLMAFYDFLYLSSNVAFDLLSSETCPRLPVIEPSRTPPSGTTQASSATLPRDIDQGSRARLPIVEREDLDAEGRALYDSVVNPNTPYSRGLPAPVGMWMHSPKMAQHILPAYMYLRYGNQFGPRLTELVILVAAREINSQYEWTAHEPIAVKAGLEQEVIDVIKHRRSLDGLGEEEALISRFGRELLGDRLVSAGTFADAQRVFGTVGVTDLAGLMALYNFLFLSSHVTFDVQMPADWQPLLPMP